MRHNIYNSIIRQKKFITENNIIVNLSKNKILTLTESAIINKGLNFCLANHKFNNNINYNKEITRFIRSIQIRYLFSDNSCDNSLKFTGNPDWNPPAHKLSDEINGYEIFLRKKIKTIIKRNKIKTNISRKELTALTNLKKDKTILIQKADKGGSIVIMDTQDYLFKIENMLSDPITYTETNYIDLPAAKTEVNRIISALYDQRFIKKSQKQFLSRCTPRIPHFYGLCKVHKKDNPLRPIVSQIDSPAYKLNKYLDYILTTAEKHIPNLLRDTTNFLQILDNLPPITPGTLLYTIDVTSLYTVLPHDMILNYVIEMYKETLPNWCTPDVDAIPDTLLRSIISIILKQTFFEFNNQLFTQNYGITMGAPSSVKLANITLHKHLQKITKKFTGTLPTLQVRYIDDIFGLFNGSLETLTEWVQYLNNSHNTIKFTMETSESQIPFLDTLVYIHDLKIKTKLHIKPTDKKQYLHYNSEHVQHVKKGIPYAQALRYRRIIVDNNIFLEELNTLKLKFISRSYPTDIVNTAMSKARNLNRMDLLNYNTPPINPWNATPFVITYSNALVSHPSININKILKDSWTDLTGILPALKSINPPKIVFKKCTSINNLLVSTRFPPKSNVSYRNNKREIINTQTNPKITLIHKSERCGIPKCFTCSNIQTTSTFSSTTFKHTHKLAFSLNCQSSNLIYLIQCKRCTLQYIGETGTKLRQRVNNHRSCIKLNVCNPVSIHFNSPNHSMEDFSIIPLESMTNDNKSERLKRETYYQLLLGTVFPRGLNQFPLDQRDKYNSLNITSPLDLINFVRSISHTLNE